MGLWLVENQFVCYNLEDPFMPPDGIGRGCIPAGVYPVTITFSNRFQRPLMLVNRVPGRSGIRVHPGNRGADTIGCSLPGMRRTTDEVLDSVTALALLQPRVQLALDAQQDVWLSVENLF